MSDTCCSISIWQPATTLGRVSGASRAWPSVAAMGVFSLSLGRRRLDPHTLAGSAYPSESRPRPHGLAPLKSGPAQVTVIGGRPLSELRDRAPVGPGLTGSAPAANPWARAGPAQNGPNPDTQGPRLEH